jgi:tyrosyl-tRNA synthetase
MRLFTDLPLDEIARLEALSGSEINEAKKILATEATAMLHGRAAAEAAAETARQAFEEGAAAEGLPTIEIPKADLSKGAGILHASTLAGLVPSTSDARRQIKGGALRLNGVTVTDERAVITLKDLNEDGVIKLSLGKKRHVLIRPAP